ncbi:site-specific DNA-methyltransferase [Crocosphaera sp. UHCC 0190]|uniref:site-specific DNA-methyltransferase n=1 Tax=Crocosphaera sp. UHCC 0190 TaxID=3110246 RepID=UPI002B1EA6B8|nr:site-specific DNA-methyltransferase [Crocosphaera sp. UHCC 0190]MEA5510444.1 site-specific DNA-methyltransferase [Crocosphaera sp. UHCC 0190]
MATGIPKSKLKNYNLVGQEDLVEQVNTEVGITYAGKTSEQDILTLPFAYCIRLGQVGKEINRLYYGDNLPILLSFLRDANIQGKVKLIYIDPPFATKSIFQSRSQTDAYCDLLEGSHYLEFIRKRLIILRELLADDGSIYVHLDENMAFHVKLILDEVFGQKNFKNWITRKKCNPKNYTRKTYGNISDFILFYTKSNNYIWNRPYEEWTEEKAIKEYPYIEAKTGRRYKKVPIHAPGTRNGETGKPWRNMNPPPGKHWQFPPKKLDEMDKRGEIYWSKNGNPRRKIYLDKSNGIPIQDIWLDYRDAHNQNIKITGYPTEKNPDLLTRIIQASSNKDDLVLDGFSGSGTTLSVASDLGRRWIGIDSSCEAILTTLKRFAQGCEPMGDFVNQGDPKIQNLQPQQLSIFADEQEINKPLINNFSLYSIESYANDLKEIMNQWLTW